MNVPVLPAKLVCAAIVFVAWTYPAQRRLVFVRPQTMLVMFRVSRKTRLEALLMSSTGLSPLAFTTVFSGTRKPLIIVRRF